MIVLYSLALAKLWRLPSIYVSARRFQIAKNHQKSMFLSVVRCMHAYERKPFRLGTSGQEPKTQICQKEKFDAETRLPHSHNVQRWNPKLSCRDLRVKNKHQARGKDILFLVLFTDQTIRDKLLLAFASSRRWWNGKIVSRATGPPFSPHWRMNTLCICFNFEG
jgi:hypothetical protein